MKKLLVVALFLTACAPGRGWFRSGPTPNASIEALYSRSLLMLDPTTGAPALDSAVSLLDAYLAYTGPVQHGPEARALRRLAYDAQRLTRVESALQEARATSAEPQPRPAEPEPRTRDDAAVREIQRLKEELTKANAELERIRKRLAPPAPNSPSPPPSPNSK